MSRHKRKRKKPAGMVPPAVASPEAVLAELQTIAEKLETADEGESGPIWGQTHKLLLKTDADAAEVAEVVMHRDVEALRRLMRRLGGESVEAPAAPDATPAPGADIPADTLKKAMRAFRKRLKLTRLDHESRINVNPLTSGKKADFDAIMPPRDFPQEVWDTLVAQGELKRMGSGFYMLGEEKS